MTRRTSILAVLVSLALIGAIVAAYYIGRTEERPFAKPTPVGDAAPAGLEEFYTQDLQWDGCGGRAQCAWVNVPIDYEKPEGETLKLRAKVIPARGEGGRSLFVNPGGPGGSAISFADSMAFRFGEGVLDDYDIVGVDPRGIGESTPVDCLSDSDFDAYAAGDPDPDDPGEVEPYQEQFVTFGEGCRESSGDLAGHISTEETARDLDVVRALVGEKKLDWFGASYGTTIGATYATLFPKKVGRMVLDGATNPALNAEGSAMGQTKGFQRALEAYIKDCVTRPSCPLGRDAEAGEKKLLAFDAELDDTPMNTRDGRKLTEGLAFYGIIYPLYDDKQWPVLTHALSAALSGEGSILLRLADQYFQRRADGSYPHNIGEANRAINCLDAADPSTLEEVEVSLPRFEKESPLFGATLAWDALSCGEWPIEITHPQIDIDATGSDPIVVLGTTRDPATPYEHARALADQLGTGVLVTRDGDGHTAYTSGNRCIKELVDDYLVDGKVPKDGVTCENE